MRGRQGLIADNSGALQTIEAVVATLLVLAALACVSAAAIVPGGGRSDDLGLMSSDLLHVLQGTEGQPAYPGLAQALSSPQAWDKQSANLTEEIYGLLPPGVMCCLVSPYGIAGDRPPDGTAMSVRPFLAFRQDADEIIDCQLIVWRP